MTCCGPTRKQPARVGPCHRLVLLPMKQIVNINRVHVQVTLLPCHSLGEGGAPHKFMPMPGVHKSIERDFRYATLHESSSCSALCNADALHFPPYWAARKGSLTAHRHSSKPPRRLSEVLVHPHLHRSAAGPPGLADPGHQDPSTEILRNVLAVEDLGNVGARFLLTGHTRKQRTVAV